ncbi:hypothetical protein B0H17DRAFT_994330 [Mycena rosella]|uniref:Uncharacterized protein n=1 Tax=Mycena rosella TaxID=1033263 RepID=A0AAD7CDQ9_MYCRO|nr:hypothetical protein B0H17DRAFT_994330 [Mycena rosella]
MSPYSPPTIDETNPLYCPAITASSYLSSLRRQARRRNSRPQTQQLQNDRSLSFFARILDKALQDGDRQPLRDLPQSDADDSVLPSSFILRQNLPSSFKPVKDSYRPPLKRKRSFSSDPNAPLKHSRTLQGSSLEIRVEREGIQHFPPPFALSTKPAAKPSIADGLKAKVRILEGMRGLRFQQHTCAYMHA